MPMDKIQKQYKEKYVSLNYLLINQVFVLEHYPVFSSE